MSDRRNKWRGTKWSKSGRSCQCGEPLLLQVSLYAPGEPERAEGGEGQCDGEMRLQSLWSLSGKFGAEMIRLSVRQWGWCVVNNCRSCVFCGGFTLAAAGNGAGKLQKKEACKTGRKTEKETKHDQHKGIPSVLFNFRKTTVDCWITKWRLSAHCLSSGDAAYYRPLHRSPRGRRTRDGPKVQNRMIRHTFLQWMPTEVPYISVADHMLHVLSIELQEKYPSAARASWPADCRLVHPAPTLGCARMGE